MDVASLVTGLAIGVVTGVAGNYFADRLTDSRREKSEIRKAKELWKGIVDRWPEIISEMQADFAKEPNVRSMFVKTKGTVIGFATARYFEYDPQKHPQIDAAFHHLSQQGFMSEEGHNFWRAHEKLVDRLANRFS